MGRFYELYADVNWKDYGGKWICRKPYHGGTEYVVVEFINWEDATGRDVELAGDSYDDYGSAYCGQLHDYPAGTYKYVVEVTEIDPLWYGENWPKNLASALESCGPTAEDMQKMSRWHRKTCEIGAAVDYGHGDVKDIRYGNNARKLLAEVKRAWS